MASISTGGDAKDRSKPSRMNLRVDFTPMVDMNMLLITFFMFCTTLSKPQTMTLVMPADDTDVEDVDRTKTKDSKTVTIILGANDKLFYYEGKPNYEDYTTLKESSFAQEGGFRDYLLSRNRDAVTKMIAVKREKRDNSKMTDAEFDKRKSEIRTNKENIVVLIKPTKESRFVNLVDALDEMAICSVGTYSIVEMASGDTFLMENLKTQGFHAANNVEAPK